MWLLGVFLASNDLNVAWGSTSVGMNSSWRWRFCSDASIRKSNRKAKMYHWKFGISLSNSKKQWNPKRLWAGGGGTKIDPSTPEGCHSTVNGWGMLHGGLEYSRETHPINRRCSENVTSYVWGWGLMTHASPPRDRKLCQSMANTWRMCNSCEGGRQMLCSTISICCKSEIPHMNTGVTGKSDSSGDRSKGDHLLLGSVSWCRPSCPVMKEQLAAHKALRGTEPGEPLPEKEPCVHYSSSHPLHHLSEPLSEQWAHAEEKTTPGRTSVSQPVLMENRAEQHP